METIIEFVKTNWLLTFGVVALIIYAVWDYVKKKKERKKRAELRKRFEEEQKEYEIKQENEAVKKEEPIIEKHTEPVKKEEASLASYFEEKKETTKAVSKEVNMDLKDFTIQVMNEKSEIEKHIKKQNDELKKELLETTKKKEEIRKQGIALAALFDKYREREEQLKEIINK